MEENRIEFLYYDNEGKYVEILGHKIDKTYESFEDFERDMASLTKFREEIANHTYYDIKAMDARDLYDVLCKDLSFDAMIELYRLINYKIRFLEELRYDMEEKEMNKWNEGIGSKSGSIL